MIEGEALQALVPHAGAMCLWQRVIAWDEDSIVLDSDGHRRPDHPLRGAQGLRAVHLCEYGAQAMAVHGGLRAAGQGGAARPGMLVALRGVRLHVDWLQALPGRLQCTAQVLMQSPDSQQYAFEITHDGVLLAEGRAAVVLGAQ